MAIVRGAAKFRSAAFTQLIVWLTGGAEADMDASPTITSGTAYPTVDEPEASLYIRTTDDTLYMRSGDIWRAIGRSPQVIDMADAQVKLVYGTAGAGEVKITGRQLLVDANSGATEKLLLMPEADSTGEAIDIVNTGGESIVVRDDGDATTIVTVATGKIARVVCDGTAWRGSVAA